MTLPRNFPERANQRRKAALERLDRRKPHWKRTDLQVRIEAQILLARIVANARAVHTKKNRSGTRVSR